MNDKEFRFIKCPGCRGLVPATATRCRMCGQELTPSEDSPTEGQTDERSYTQGSERGGTNYGTSHDRNRSYTTLSQRGEKQRDRNNTVDWAAGEAVPGGKADSDKTSGRSGSIYDFLKKDFDEIERVEDDYPIEADPYAVEDNGADYEDVNLALSDVDRRIRTRTMTTGFTAPSAPPVQPEQPSVSRSRKPAVQKTAEPKIEEVKVSETIKVKPTEESYRTEGKMINEQKNNSQIHIKSSNQQLIGWLLSFKKDNCGNAVEIREGRFFVTNSKVRETDLVISDGSLSVPHCLMKADRDLGIQVQDLMSENGTYIRKEHSGEFEPVTTPTTAEHGDWLRFGDYEVMVCVVPSEGRHMRK